MHNNKKVVWIVDIENWAFDIKAKAISQNLINYDSVIIAISGLNKNQLNAMLDKIKPDLMIISYNQAEIIYDCPKIYILASKRQIEKKSKKKIVWIVDVPNWAFDIRAKAISERLINYNFLIIATRDIKPEILNSMLKRLNPDLLIFSYNQTVIKCDCPELYIIDSKRQVNKKCRF